MVDEGVLEQPFRKLDAAETQRQPILLNEILLPWAEQLPEKPGKILDIAGGAGIEAKSLGEASFDVFNLDLSLDMLRNAYHDRNVQGRVHTLPFGNESFSGALLKDAWVFLPPETQSKLLQESKRVLIEGGSLLIVSEQPETHGALSPRGYCLSSTPGI